MSLILFARRNVRPLLFGAIHAFYSAPGQTYVIGLFVAAMGMTVGLRPTEIGGLYLAATLASAATIVFVRYWIDHIRLVHFSGAVVVGLAIACFATALAASPFTLFLGFYLLRLTGQGLMMHVEGTATARTFDHQRGRALSITALGTPLAEVIFPPLAIAGIAIIGWQATYGWMGLVALVVVLPATQWLLRTFKRAPPGMTKPEGEGKRLLAGLGEFVRSRNVLVLLPSLAIFPFHMTGVMFHIRTIADDRNWTATALASSFSALAVTSVIGLFVAGMVVDRISAKRFYPLINLPLLASLAIIATFDAPWSAPVGFGVMGLGAGLARTTLGAIWPELFGIKSLGAIRSAFTMFMVFMSGLAPFVFGLALDMGATVSGVLWAMVAYGLIAIIPAFSIRTA
ncbi:MAG: MFS transporter [Alphaproteobacteria bacterium]